MDISGVEIDATAHTGLYFVQHGPDGHAFSYLRRGSAASLMTPATLDGGLIERARFLHVSGISLAISTSACDTVFAAIARARAAGVQVSLDSNLRLRLWPLDRARAVLREALCHADLFLPSMDDMQHLTGNDDPERTLDWIRDAGATGVVVLNCLLYTSRFRRWPSHCVQTLASPSYQAFQAVSSPVCSSSKPCSCRPVPKQPVHQPCLELYENRRGSGSGKLVPHDGQARLTEKCCCCSSLLSASCSLFTGHTTDITPWPFSSALLTAARSSASLAAVSYTHLDVYKRQAPAGG